MPTNTKLEVDLEDVGFPEEPFLSYQCNHHQNEDDADHNHSDVKVIKKWWENVCGGSWIAENSSLDDLLLKSRVAFAVHQSKKQKWTVLIGKFIQVELWNGEPDQLLQYMPEMDLSSVDCLIPLIEPRRVVTPNGVVFVG